MWVVRISVPKSSIGIRARTTISFWHKDPTVLAVDEPKKEKLSNGLGLIYHGKDGRSMTANALNLTVGGSAESGGSAKLRLKQAHGG